MSRMNIDGEKYDLAFGVDNITGPFFQVWLSPQYDQDCAIVAVDNHGVRKNTEDPEAFSNLPAGAVRFLHDLEEQMKVFPGCHIGEEQVIEIARLLNEFPDITKQVYEVFD